MKKIISINISGTSFFIDEDAYDKLNGYINKLKNRFNKEEEGQEIITDIETRLCELFTERINPKTGVITLSMVEEVMQIMGRPEDFSDEEDSGEETIFDNEKSTRRRQLYRDVDNQILGGVCSGIAAYFNIDPVLVRVIFAVLPFFSFGIVIPVYIVLWIVIPSALTTTQKMEMRGENITVSNIEKKIKEEYDDVKKRFNDFKKTNKTYKQSEDYIKKMNNRDRNILIIIGGIILLMIITRLTFHFPGHCGFINVFPFTIFFPGFFTIAAILLILGLIFRSSLRVFVYIILIMAAISLFIKLIIWIFGATFFPFIC